MPRGIPKNGKRRRSKDAAQKPNGARLKILSVPSMSPPIPDLPTFTPQGLGELLGALINKVGGIPGRG